MLLYLLREKGSRYKLLLASIGRSRRSALAEILQILKAVRLGTNCLHST